MTQKEFYVLADEITRSTLEDNDPVNGKDKALVDLLLKAYEEDLSVYVAGQTNIGNGLIGITGIPLPLGRNAQGLICYTSPAIAEKEPDHLQKIEVKVRDFFKYVYMNNFIVGLLFNYQIDDAFITIGIDDLTKWLSASVKKDMKAAQNKVIRTNPSLKKRVIKLL